MGSGHAALSLRTDWQRQLAQARQDLGVKRVRFHGILDDDIGGKTGEAAPEKIRTAHHTRVCLV